MSQSLAVPVRTSRMIQLTPFYYGWVVLIAGTVGSILSSPGQTFSISIFIEYFIHDLGISRSLISTFYTIGTLVGSFALPFIGRQIDLKGPRLTTGIISALFGLACLYMSTVHNGWMLLIGFIAVRMLGQGSLSLVSNYVISQWWLRRRGTMLGISGVVMALLGIGGFPVMINWLIPQVGWRMTWVILGMILLVIMVPVGLLLFRARPEVFGLLPDGASSTPTLVTSQGEMFEENWTSQEARRTAAFWIITIGLSSISMLSTGLQFHMVSIFLDNHLSADAAAGVYVPLALTTAVMTLVSGVLVDRISVRYLLIAALLLQTVSMWLAPSLSSLWMATLYGVLLGCLSGLQRTVSTVVYASYFGRLHLGAISGISSTIMVAGSALGPLPMAMARDLLGQYTYALYWLSLLPFALAIVSFWMKRPRRATGFVPA